ncbi:MAG: NnrU family protein [Balneolaceae bacterium]|jgi:protein-S-isoprenylcysteine O-methyltransferase Ste14/lysophospholipase L1-like esterase
MRVLKIIFSLLCYVIGFGCIIYYFDFFTGYFVPKGINSGNPQSFLNAVFIDLGLLMLFGLQHSLMARTGFKEWSEKKLPSSLTRSYYILLSSIVLGIVIWLWQPIPLVIYDVKGTPTGDLLLGLYYLGWTVGLLSTFEIDHFELFGVKQALYPGSDESQDLKMPFFYRVVRHPIYLGWILIHWMTPMMTVGHLLFAAGITVYIYVAIIFEEHDLIKQFGDQYQEYKKTTPRLNPLLYPFKQSPMAMKLIKVAGLIAIVAVIGYGARFVMWVGNEIAMMKSDDPLIWQDEMTHLTEKNKPMRGDSSAVLFVGSSSFRFWDHIEEDLTPIKVINNGFGGAKVPDVFHYKEELIYAYHPQKLVFFLGSNDISGAENDKSPEELYDLYARLAMDVHQKFPDCQMYILAITPTLARWNVWPEVKKANETIRSHSERVNWVTYLDVDDSFLSDLGEPEWKYYKWDGTHLSREGYQIWSQVLKKKLMD